MSVADPLHPGFHIALKWKSIVAAQRGAESEAIAVVKQLRSSEPDMPIEQHVWQIERLTRLRDRTTESVATLRRLWAETEVDA